MMLLRSNWRLATLAASILLGVSVLAPRLAHADTTRYEVDVQTPSCEGDRDDVKIIDEDSDWSDVDDSGVRVFCVRPGDYTGVGDITLTADGSADARRYLVYDAPHGPDATETHPVAMDAGERAVVQGLVFDNADWWAVQGLFVDGGQRLDPSGDGLRFLDHSTNNVVDRSVVHHGRGTLVQIEHGSSHNSLQNSVVRETDSNASSPSKDFHCIHLKGDKPGTRHNRIVQNEIYDCAGDSIHFSGCPYWLPDAHERSYDCGFEGEKDQRFAGDTRGTIVWDNDLYVTSGMRDVCGGSCGCYENAIDIKSTMGSTDRSQITEEDWVRIERNRIWDDCDGSLSSIIAHFANSDYVLLRHNIVFGTRYAYRPVRKDDRFVDHHSVVGNVFADVENMTSVSKIAEHIEFYNNVVVDVPGRILAGYGDSKHFDLQCNAVVNGGEWSIQESVVHSDYNDFYATPSFGSGDDNQSHGSASEARMDDLCFERKVWTAGEQHCIEGAKTTSESPHRGRCPSSLGAYDNVGVHDESSEAFFRPYVDARILSVDVSATPKSGPAPLEVQFEAVARHAAGTVDYEWDFDDGATASASSPTHTFDESGEYEVSVTVTDQSDGETSTRSVTITVEEPGQTRFSSVPYYGDFDNWEAKTPSRWEVTDYDGDTRLSLATTEYEPDGDMPGEFAVVRERRFEEFTMALDYQTGESIDSNEFADVVVFFGFVDRENFHFLTAHHQAQYAKLFRVVDGDRELVRDLNRSLLPDENWHRLEIEARDGRVRLRFDGTEVFEQEVRELRLGRVGVGSFDEAAYFDDVTVERPQGAEPARDEVGPDPRMDVAEGDLRDVAESPDIGDRPDGGDNARPPDDCGGCTNGGSTVPGSMWMLLLLAGTRRLVDP